MRYVFIINPKAGSQDRSEELKATVAALPQKDQCEFYFTKSVGDATVHVRQWCDAHPGEEVRFIACGGDGTINEVFNGAAGREDVSVTCWPVGSGNDFAKVFGGAEKFMDIGKLLTAPTQKLDLLKVGDRYSVNVVNFGFDTTVAITINKEREKTGHGGKSAYTKGVVKALLTSMRNEFTVTADGELLDTKGKALLCTVANGQYVGGSFKCAPRAKTDDGLLEVCLPYAETNMSAWDMVDLAMGVLSSDILTKLENGEALLQQHRIPMDETWKYYTTEGGASVVAFRNDKRLKENIEGIHTFIYGEYIPAD